MPYDYAVLELHVASSCNLTRGSPPDLPLRGTPPIKAPASAALPARSAAAPTHDEPTRPYNCPSFSRHPLLALLGRAGIADHSFSLGTYVAVTTSAAFD